MIVKYTVHQANGIIAQHINRHMIGYVVSGTKYIYDGDRRLIANSGDMFYLNIGHHYIEDKPNGDEPFEQISFFYTSEEITRIITYLYINFNVEIDNNHVCQNCRSSDFVTYPAWSLIRDFFSTIQLYIQHGIVSQNNAVETLKTTELLYHLITTQDCCIKRKILNHTDSAKEGFEQIIHDNIFNEITLEALAKLCNRSITSFKKEFKNHFFESPHRWFIKQRLKHARLLLVSSSKSISEIGNECSFNNTSHFIKLFKKEFELTPASYRTKYKREIAKEIL